MRPTTDKKSEVGISISGAVPSGDGSELIVSAAAASEIERLTIDGRHKKGRTASSLPWDVVRPMFLEGAHKMDLLLCKGCGRFFNPTDGVPFNLFIVEFDRDDATCRDCSPKQSMPEFFCPGNSPVGESNQGVK